MEQPGSKESSPAPSERGLKGVIAKAKRSRKDNPSTTSVNGTDNGTDNGSEGHSLRNSVDSLVDKALSTRHSSVDDSKSTAGDKLSKLVPARIQKKRRERKEAVQQQYEEERGRRSGDQGGSSAYHEPHSGQQSPGDYGGSSLITMGSAPESPLDTPPPLISHQSHIGYLTSTSPLIKSNTISASATLHTDIPAFQPPEYPKSATLPISSKTSSTTNLAPRNAATLDARQAEKETSRNGRGISPGAKIKDVFTGGSRKKRGSPSTSPDRASVMSAENGTTLGGPVGTADRSKGSTSILEDRPTMPQSMDTDMKIKTVKKPDIPNISTIPRTPPSASLDTPSTTVTPPTPTDQLADLPGSPSAKPQQSSRAGTNPNTVTSASGNMSSHRRARSDSAMHQPSRLSNTMSAPLTPTIEESNTPGTRSPGSSGSPGGPAGFFSSVFSAAQNAANTLSNTIANNPPRSRSSSQAIDEGNNQNIETASTTVEGIDKVLPNPKKELAIDTLGSGDLSLHHLGIATEPPSTGNSTTGTFPTISNSSPRGKEGSIIQREEAAARAEDASAARAVSAAYSDVALNEQSSTPVAEDPAPGFKSKSTYESSLTGDRTPPNGSIFEGENSFKRSGSVRSRVGAVARRHRNSSVVTGSTIAAALGSGHSALANPAASSSTPKLTGFAVASKKRNRDFHQLFRSVPEDDYLIEDYSCALQRDIILAGRIYVSESHICFSSNILGWVTTLIISFDEVVSIEKETTAMVFPNAIAIQTLHARQTFRSLLSREATYELLVGIWKLSHPQLKSSLNGVRLDTGGTGDKTEKAEPSSEDASDISEEEEVYDEDEEEDEGIGSFTEAGEGSVVGSDVVEPVSKPAIRKASAMGHAIGSAAGGVPTIGDARNIEKAAAASAASVDFPGPTTHAPTECTDGDTHYDKILKDEVIPAPLGKVYSMIFGPASGGFMNKWLLDDIKVTELQMEDDKKGLDAETKSRSYSYIKPLYASIGPKSTKCLIVENMDFFDLEKSVSVTVSTQTPDVPSGSVFTTKTKFCLMWAPENATRLLMNFTIEWTGKSWLKGPIEKGASDGQGTYANDLVKALKLGLSARSRSNTLGSKLKSKPGKRRKGDPDVSKSSLVDTTSKTPAAGQKQAATWGILEPLHLLLGPVADPIMTLINSQVVIGFLLVTLLVTWYRFPPRHSPNSGTLGLPTPERMAAYEEIWRAEESELWNWLEERVGMQGLAYPADARRKEENLVRKREKGEAKGVRARLAEERMGAREVDEAIRVTEERLRVLKGVVGRGKEMGTERGGEGGVKGSEREEVVKDAESDGMGDEK